MMLPGHEPVSWRCLQARKGELGSLMLIVKPILIILLSPRPPLVDITTLILNNLEHLLIGTRPVLHAMREKKTSPRI